MRVHRFRIACAAWAALFLAGAAMADSVHVSPNGNDAQPGTAAQPVRTIAKAVALVATREGPQEIVIHEGVYAGNVMLPARDNPPPLVIRAAKRSDGSYEDAILDGSRPMDQAQPVAGMPGVFRLALKTNARDDHSVWEEDTRVRYASMADQRAVVQVPASYALTDAEVFFHTSDGRPPASHRVAMSRDEFGFHLFRGRVTFQGLQFRHFLTQSGGEGIGARQGEIVVEDCRFWNSMRAVSVGTDGHRIRMTRCRADDVAAGVKTLGTDLVVEDCQFIRRPGRFEIPEYSQDQSGVQVYHPGSRAEVRRTLCAGFSLGIFFKCTPGRFVVEHNTVVVPGEPHLSYYGIGCTGWFPESVFRHNIVAGYSSPILKGDEKGVVPGAVVDANCLWGRGAEEAVKSLAKCGAGRRNVNAAPKFAAPDKDDYRLRPDSPAARLAADGESAGAFGLADGKPIRLLPAVKGALDVAAPASLTPPSLAPAFVKRAGPARAWYVDPVKGLDKPAAGTEDKPLRSLQLALNLANAGDRVILLPGVYFGPHTLNHGGTKDAPIVIESSVAGGAILDGMKQYDEPNLALDKAPHVVLLGLEVRWFKTAGVRLNASPQVRIENCTFWNDHWSRGRYIGEGIQGAGSPGLAVERCLLYAMNRPIQLNDSPGFRITHCTITMGLHHGVRFHNSAADSVFRNNSVAFGGSYLMAVYPGEDVKSFDCDYNNWGANIRADSRTRPAPDEEIKPIPGDFFASKPSKYAFALGQGDYIAGLRAWQARTGRDQHSIFKHPRYADPAKRDFRLLPDSLNVGAGEGGTNIGAGEVAR